MLTLSQRERDRLVVVRQVVEGQLKVAEGARRLGMGTRHMRRLVRRYEAEGDGAMSHGLRGRPSNRRLDEGLRTRALAKAREAVYRDFGPTLLSEHLERDPAIGYVDPSTLRLWMIADGLWEPRKRKHKHRRRRERRAAPGELVLMDTSIHDWLEGRSSESLVLIALIDDATSRLFCRFFARDTGAANRTLLVDYLARWGRMGAVYADQAGHFRANFRRTERREKDQAEAITLIQQALGALDVELIFALSPQAKGRVERLFGTLQDRLIKEMRVAGVESMEAANRFLVERFIPFWDERYTVAPREATDAHRPLPKGVDLLRLFAGTDERVIRNDFTFRFKNRVYQIEAESADGAMPGTRITIEHRLDGTRRFRWRERYLLPTPLFAPPVHPLKPVKSKAARPKPPAGGVARPPSPDHPWRHYRLGKARSTSPAPRATLLTPTGEGAD